MSLQRFFGSSKLKGDTFKLLVLSDEHKNIVIQIITSGQWQKKIKVITFFTFTHCGLTDL